MKDELGKKIMVKFLGLRAKASNYLRDHGTKNKKWNSSKNCVLKTKIKFENYKTCLEANQLENEINHLEKK